MILYNVTVGIDEDVEEEWLAWMIQIHIPEVMATEMFKDFEVYKIISEEKPGTSSYSIQYFAESMNEIQYYLSEYAPALVQRHMERYKDKHVAFRTLLEKVS